MKWSQLGEFLELTMTEMLIKLDKVSHHAQPILEIGSNFTG